MASPKDWKKNVTSFDNAYKSNFGVFFTSFILSVDKQYDKLMKKQFPNKNKVISHYSKLKDLAIEIGEESVRVLENLKSTNAISLTREQFQELKHKSLFKFRLIIKECDDMVEKI